MVVDFWSEENPNLDLLVKGLAIRLRRVSHHLDRALASSSVAGDIEVWEAEALALRRSADDSRSEGEFLKDIPEHLAPSATGSPGSKSAVGCAETWTRRTAGTSWSRSPPLAWPGPTRCSASKAQAELAVLGRLDLEVQERLNNDLRTLLIALEGPAQPGDESLKHKRAELAP